LTNFGRCSSKRRNPALADWEKLVTYKGNSTESKQIFLKQYRPMLNFPIKASNDKNNTVLNVYANKTSQWKIIANKSESKIIAWQLIPN